MPRVHLTQEIVDGDAPGLQLPEAGRRIEFWDCNGAKGEVGVPGLVLRVDHEGNGSYSVVTRITGRGERARQTIGRASAISLKDARNQARIIVGSAAAGIKHKAAELEASQKDRAAKRADREARRAERERLQREKGEKISAVVKAYLADKEVKAHRSFDEQKRIFERYVNPLWGERGIKTITRKDVKHLMAAVSDRRLVYKGKRLGGETMAKGVFRQVRILLNWFAIEMDERFVPPNLRKIDSQATQRSRVLSDEELAVMWPLLDRHALFGKLCKLALFTAARRSELSGMLRTEIDFDEGVWSIEGRRYKTSDDDEEVGHVLPLSAPALAIIEGIPRLNRSNLIFTHDGKRAYSAFARPKIELDRQMLAALQERAVQRGRDPRDVVLKPWRIHDLRRTSRTLLARIKVRTDIAERILGHSRPSIELTYDRHHYLPELREALDVLAAELERITAPPAGEGVQKLATRPEVDAHASAAE